MKISPLGIAVQSSRIVISKPKNGTLATAVARDTNQARKAFQASPQL
jgi:hypothetical protein